MIAFGREAWMTFILLLLMLISSLGLIYLRDLNRQVISQLNTLQIERDDLHVEWGRLLLEFSTWGAPARIQRIAEEQLHMSSPPPQSVVMVGINHSLL